MLDFILFVLAVFGVSSFLVEYSGPWYIFTKLRDRFEDSPLHCIPCTSVYVTALFMVLQHFGITGHIYPLATIGAIILSMRIEWKL